MRATSAVREAVAVIGVAVIGLGGIGMHHARTLANEFADATLVMVVDPLADLARAVARQLGVRAALSCDDALADPAVDAVVIATPTPLHPELVVQAAVSGRHVFCEKPLGPEPELARHATNVARERGVRLQVGFQRRFDNDFVAAKECIAGGELGAVRLLRISHRNRVPPHPTGLVARLGSIFLDMTIHDFDSARWLVGDVNRLDAYATPHAALVVLTFENGAIGVIDNMRCAGYGFECGIEVVGSEATIRLGGRTAEAQLERLTAAGSHTPLPADHVERHVAAYREELRHFVGCIRSGVEPSVGGDDAVAALRLSLEAERCVA